MSPLGLAFIARIDAMETVTLDNDVEMPALGLGVFQTPPDETRDAVSAALGVGYRHIDTAAAYGNERRSARRCTAPAWTGRRSSWRPRSGSATTDTTRLSRNWRSGQPGSRRR